MAIRMAFGYLEASALGGSCGLVGSAVRVGAPSRNGSGPSPASPARGIVPVDSTRSGSVAAANAFPRESVVAAATGGTPATRNPDVVGFTVGAATAPAAAPSRLRPSAARGLPTGASSPAQRGATAHSAGATSRSGPAAAVHTISTADRGTATAISSGPGRAVIRSVGAATTDTDTIDSDTVDTSEADAQDAREPTAVAGAQPGRRRPVVRTL